MMHTDTNNNLTITTENMDNQPASLSRHVKLAVRNYFKDLDGHDPSDLYNIVLAEIEKPLLETVMEQVRGNQSRAARLLGINRSTLRKKLSIYGLAN